MSSIFDAGDIQRLDRDNRLMEQRPRQPISEPENEPIEEPFNQDEFIDDSILGEANREESSDDKNL